jgi:hypothetical protein
VTVSGCNTRRVLAVWSSMSFPEEAPDWRIRAPVARTGAGRSPAAEPLTVVSSRSLPDDPVA